MGDVDAVLCMKQMSHSENVREVGSVSEIQLGNTTFEFHALILSYILRQ